MGCLRLKKQVKKGIVIQMPKNKKNTKDEKVTKVQTPTVNNEQRVEVVQIPKALAGAFTIVGVGIIGFMAVQLYDMKEDIGSLKKSVENVATKDDISNVSGRVDIINSNISGIDADIDEIDTKVGELKTRISVVESRLDMTPINATDGISSDIQASISFNDISKVASAAVAAPAEVIGTDNEGNVYLAENLINETILLTYTEGTQEVYFLGQYNEEYRWDGKCIINVYNADDTLCIITDANYDGGKLVDYKQVIPGDSGTKWIYSERKHMDQVNEGKTYTYQWEYKQRKNFTNSNVRADDIYSAEYFHEKIEGNLISYYSGNTADGKYNDDTGNAYLVSYTEDGFISVLYVGGFADGEYSDDTGNAWEIVFDGSNNINRYFYYRGKFRNGTRRINEKLDYLTQEEIDAIVGNVKFDCDLNWYQSE